VANKSYNKYYVNKKLEYLNCKSDCLQQRSDRWPLRHTHEIY
jgi:hypothetical protein